MGAQQTRNLQRSQDGQIRQLSQINSITIPQQNIQIPNQEEDLNNYQLNQHYLKDQPFQQQKYNAIRSLLLFLIKQIIILILTNFNLSLWFLLYIKPYLNFQLFGCVFIVLIILTRFSIFQETPFSYAIYILNLLLEPYILVHLYLHLSISRDILINFYLLFMRFTCSFFSIVVLLVYFCFEQNAIELRKVGLFFGVAGGLSTIFVFKYLWSDLSFMLILIVFLSVSLMILTGLLLSLVIKQMLEGRFSLKIQQIFGFTNAINFGLLFPCNF